MHALVAQIRSWGAELGFDAIRIADVDLSHAEEGLQTWLAQGFHGDMDYMANHGMLRARPAELVAGTVRAIVGRMPYLPHLADPQTGAPVFQPLWYGGTVAALERALQACPDTIFIGHAPGFWREISGDADAAPSQYPTGPVTPGGRLHRLLDTYPNLWADLSAGSGRQALSRDPAHALQFITRYADRLLFGRDYYGTELHTFLQTLPLSAAVVEKIYWQNAERLS